MSARVIEDRKRWAAALVTLTALCAPAAHAQTDAPARPTRIIVGYPPASSNDLLARFVGSKLTERSGQQVVVENRPGANGMIASDHTARATPDGHTLMLVSVSHTMSAAVSPNLPYDTVKSFTPVATLGAGPLILVTYPSFPATQVKALIEIAKNKPGSLNYASAGIGGINHFAGALFSRVAGVQLTHVPYKGGAPALTDVIAGQVQLLWGSMPLTLPQVRVGKAKALAVTSAKRSPLLPEVPTIAEGGAPGAEISIWWGLLAPAGMSAPVLTRLNATIGTVLREPETTQRLAAAGAEPWILSSAEFGRVIRSEVQKWTRISKDAHIRAE